MHYKTMVLELLQQCPEIHDQLRRQRMLLPALEVYSSELKTRHQAWKDLLWQEKPDSAESQISSEALEIALKELQDHLLSASPPEDNEPLSLDEAMAFLRRHTPPA